MRGDFGIFCVLFLSCVNTHVGFGQGSQEKKFTFDHGAITRGDTSKKKLAIVFTGDEFGDGGAYIAKILRQRRVKASFFLTGNFYRSKTFQVVVKKLIRDGHYLGAHSDKHLLYCDWKKRDSLLVSKQEFISDLQNNYGAMSAFGVSKEQAHYFLPPYEWYNDSIASWTKSIGLQLINFTPGTTSHADYTTPDMPNYRSSEVILKSILKFDSTATQGLNGFIFLMHIGTSPLRTDKLYRKLPMILKYLHGRGYQLVRINELLER
jgi:endoglucanase